MSDNRLIGNQLKIMLSGLSKHGVQHISEMENDLLQTNVLLEEAIGKLVASFMAIHGALSVQRELIEGLASGRVPNPETVAGIVTISEDVERHITDAITSMQFQDMTRQLVERTLKRVAGLRGIMASLGSCGVGLPSNPGVGEIVAVLRSINKQLALQNDELNQMLWKTVRQKHMDSGDIELF